LIAAALKPRLLSRSASSTVAIFVRTNTITASKGSTSSMRVSASSLWVPATIQTR